MGARRGGGRIIAHNLFQRTALNLGNVLGYLAKTGSLVLNLPKGVIVLQEYPNLFGHIAVKERAHHSRGVHHDLNLPIRAVS